MANIATLLKAEIKKQTDKAVRDSLRPLAKQLREEKKRVKDLERQIAQLSKAVAKGGPVAASAPVKTSTSRKSKWSGATVTNLRKKHKLSQNAMAKLLGVGINTVWLWEQGRTNPRAKQQEGISALEELSGLQVRRRLAKVGLTVGRSKPGRKPGSKNKKPVLAKKAAKASKPVNKASKKVAKKVTKKATKKVAKKAPRKVAKKTAKKAPK
jgi:DNA-binding transcriptional regulator YiaG